MARIYGICSPKYLGYTKLPMADSRLSITKASVINSKNLLHVVKQLTGRFVHSLWECLRVFPFQKYRYVKYTPPNKLTNGVITELKWPWPLCRQDYTLNLKKPHNHINIPVYVYLSTLIHCHILRSIISINHLAMAQDQVH